MMILKKIYIMKHNCFSFHNKLMKYICLALILLIAHACKTNKDSSAIETIQPILDPPQVTILSNLPDSLQPKTILLKDVPKPLIVTIPTKVGGTYPSKNGLGEIVRVKLLPTVIKPLQSDIKGIGLALIDSLGKSILGLGGKSDFTTFTTDNGLALDGIPLEM